MNGLFSAEITAMPASFDYTVTDANGDTSAPATVTLTSGSLLDKML
jgi:hypothetical protein